jgi:predicted lipoprotein with Yx(FWY)xxD motif
MGQTDSMPLIGGWHLLARSTAVLALVLALTACGGTGGSVDTPTSIPSSGGSPSATPSRSAAPSPTQQERAGTGITTGSSPYGPMLFDQAGQAIYIWERETTDEPQCYEGCATAWPPVLTDGPPSAAGEVNAGNLGTTKRRDGSVQVTYNNHPLYYYAHEAPGEVKCHNVRTHGGTWWVVTPAGDRAP